MPGVSWMYAGQAGASWQEEGDHLGLPGLRLNNVELLLAFRDGGLIARPRMHKVNDILRVWRHRAARRDRPWV